MRAIQIQEFGGPEVLVLREVAEPEPYDGATLVDVSSAGVNYADTHQVDDSYPMRLELPLIPGGEVVGTTPDGRRVVALMAGGGYAERALTTPQLTWEVPEAITDGQALAVVLQGTTAWHLLNTSARVREGESVVVHAAAGGVGTLAIQLCKTLGAGRVIGVASTEDKRALARELGADAVVDSNAPDLTAALIEANNGRPVDVVLEMVGGDTFDQSLQAVAPYGRLVHYGAASRIQPGAVPAPELLATSRGVLGFWLVHLLARPDLMTSAIDQLFAQVLTGELKPIVGGEYPLAEAHRAHRDISERASVGKLILIP